VVPIVGARRLAHLESNLAGLDVALHADQLRRLDEVSRFAMRHHPAIEDSLRLALQFAGSTVDGAATGEYPPLRAGTARY
jgi:hypothetical protein